jgi:hypothetical protein
MRETTNYMILGYAVSLIIFTVIIGSIWWRYQTLAKDEALLEQLEQLEQDEFENRQTTEIQKDVLPVDAKSASSNAQSQTITT